jgi:glucose/arabinose dehydrogenase
MASVGQMNNQHPSKGLRRIPVAAALALAALVLGVGFAWQGSASAGGGIRAVQVAEFDSPVYVENAPGAPNLLFVVEQGGRVEVLRGRRPLDRPFLNLSDEVQSGGEEGLLSIAFAPDYERSRRFYVYFTNNDGDIEIDEFKRSRRRPARANPRSRREVITIPHPGASNHNGGTVAFGPGDLLFFATGDGGGAGDQFDNARDTESLLGKLLRIDPREGGSGRPYRVPADNPYVGRPGRDEIFAYGLRNPFRWSFDGDVLAIGDVGQGEVEEINIAPLSRVRGANFGWPQFEGNQPFDPDRPGADPHSPPIHAYPREGGNCAVTGGGIVRDPGLPSLRGRYLYADHCAGALRSFTPNLAANRAEGDAPVGVRIPGPTSFVVGARKQLYVTSLEGGLYRLEQ